MHDGWVTDLQHEAQPEPEDGELPEDRFLNREISWLDFNKRILALAEDHEAPLLERAKFLAIFAVNLDEFFMVRVAGLKRRQSMGLGLRGSDGLGPREQLAQVTEISRELESRHALCFVDEAALVAAQQVDFDEDAART